MLSLGGLTARDPEVLRAAYLALGLLGRSLIAPVSFGALVTGVVLGLGTGWGLLRHYWVLAKLVLTVGMTAAANLLLTQHLREASARVLAVPVAVLTGADVGVARFQILAAACVSLLLLLTATALSTYKPWGRTARRAAARHPAPDSRKETA